MLESGSRLAVERAALRRVATLVARESSPVEVLGAVTQEVARVLGTEAVGMLRFEPDGTASLIAQSDTPWDPPPLGFRFTLEGDNVIAPVLRTGRAARFDDWGSATGMVAEMARSLGIRSSVATPIVVEGRLWGTMIAVSSRSEPLPADTESRIGDFTELVATAISNIDSREQRARLAAEQAALRRGAALVARGAPPAGVFAAGAEELGRLLDVGSTGLVRFGDDDTATVVAGWGRLGETVAVGARLPVSGTNVVSQVARTGRPARLDDHAEDASGPIAEHARRVNTRAAIGGPIVVAGRLDGGGGTAVGGEGGAAPGGGAAGSRRRGSPRAVQRARRNRDRQRRGACRAGPPRGRAGGPQACGDARGGGGAGRGAVREGRRGGGHRPRTGGRLRDPALRGERHGHRAGRMRRAARGRHHGGRPPAGRRHRGRRGGLPRATARANRRLRRRGRRAIGSGSLSRRQPDRGPGPALGRDGRGRFRARAVAC